MTLGRSMVQNRSQICSSNSGGSKRTLSRRTPGLSRRTSDWRPICLALIPRRSVDRCGAFSHLDSNQVLALLLVSECEDRAVFFTQRELDTPSTMTGICFCLLDVWRAYNRLLCQEQLMLHCKERLPDAMLYRVCVQSPLCIHS